jgi:two-component system sensor histidine kinase DctS
MAELGASRLVALWAAALRLVRNKLDASLPWGSGRRSLWGALIALVLAVLATLVWLAGRYEASQVQAELERDTANAVGDLRGSLSRQVQALQALQSGHF